MHTYHHQILLAKRAGRNRVVAGTGAGQHGVATASVCARFGIECVIYMGSEDVRRQALNVFRMEMLGAKVDLILLIRPHLFIEYLSLAGSIRKFRFLHPQGGGQRSIVRLGQ